MALNDDAIAEILLRLPFKSVCRFRCVSKLWLSHTSSPRFIRAHAASAPAEPYGFYVYAPFPRRAEFFSLDGGGRGSHDPTLSFLDHNEIRAEPVDSCNGLLLCGFPKNPTGKLSALIVCNPTTKERESIPWPRAIRHEITAKSLRLAFDPRRSPHYMLFAVTGQLIYKYASEKRSWKRIRGLTLSTWPCRPSVYWNGSFVWSADYNMLAALDVEDAQIRALLLPAPRNIQKYLHLAASGDRLHYIRGEDQTLFEILEMTSVSSGWRVLHRIDIGSVNPLCDSSRHLLEFIRGDEDWLLLRMPTKIVSYHPRQKIFTTICQVDQAMDGYTIFPLAHTLSPLQMKSSSRKKRFETAYGTCTSKPKCTTMRNAVDAQCREEQESIQGEDGQESVTRSSLPSVNTMRHAARERTRHAARERKLRLAAEYF